MSEQQQKSTTPVLCKMGCGFFGNEATGNCCSKCWMQSLKASVAESAAPAEVVTDEPSTHKPEVGRPVTPVSVEQEAEIEAKSPTATPSDAPTTTTTVTPPTTATTTKKKKKTSYKKMMASMMTKQDTNKVENERKALSKNLGGGAFSKVDKI